MTARPIWIALLSAAVLLVGSLQLTRPGYSVDEEFTVFAVRGIQATGLPLLPSGLLYDRGIAYSYASWLVGAVSGSQLSAYRAVSLLTAVATLAIVFTLVSRVSSTTAALVASLLVASSMPFWSTATTARFYAPFLLSYVSALLALGTLRLAHGLVPEPSARSGQALGTHPIGTLGTFGTLGTLALLAALCRWCHELAFTLLALPALGVVVAPKGEKRLWWRAGVAIGVGLVGGQALLFVLHYFVPSSGDTMIRRFFVWQVVNLFETPPDRQYGIMLAVMVIGWLLAPRRAYLICVIAFSGVGLVVAYSIARASNSAPISRELVAAVMSDGARYPLDMFWHLARANPVTVVVAMGLMVTRLLSHSTRQASLRAGPSTRPASLMAGGEWPITHRAIHLLWIGWVLWFGVVESGITINYLLVPVSLMLIAIAVDLSATRPQAIVVALVVLAVISDQWRGDGSLAARLAAARPTISAPGIDEIRNGLQPTDRIACTDELGCLMLVNRIDAWLALDDYVRERFVVRRGDETTVGVYTGVPAVRRPADLFTPKGDGPLPERTLIIDVFKEYPIGNSRTWLPRALEADGLQVLPLLETPQLRVLQVSPAESVAVRQR